jgi:hypothetical protein
VGGDTLEIAVQIGEGSHALVTTPGATRFYRSDGEPALQDTRLRLAPGARLEWLPLEAICHTACLAENRLHMDLAPGAELMGWDVTALGLPLAGDRVYPVLLPPEAEPGQDAPLGLLARELEFRDPLSGKLRHWCSTRTLAPPPETSPALTP